MRYAREPRYLGVGLVLEAERAALAVVRDRCEWELDARPGALGVDGERDDILQVAQRDAILESTGVAREQLSGLDEQQEPFFGP